MTLPVFLAHECVPAIEAASIGDKITLGGDEGRHAAKVKRITVGERLDLVNGSGLRVRGSVSDAQPNTITVTVEERWQEKTPSPRLTLVQALAKGGRDEQAIEMATEIGVDQILAWQASRSIVKWAGSKSAKALGKWESILQAAAKQSRRAYVPTAQGPYDSKKLAAWIGAICAEGGVVFIAHEEGTRSLVDELAARGWRGRARGGEHAHSEASLAELPAEIAVVVGPEGGISPEELTAFAEAGATVVLLGPHVLRSSSAGSTALTLISAATGRW